MKKLNGTSMKVVVALTAAALGSVWIATAQTNTAPQQQQPPPQGEIRRAAGPMPEAAGFGLRVNRVLTEEQRASWHDAAQAQQEKMRELQKNLRDARRALLEASLAEKPDEEAIHKQAETIGKAEGEMAVLQAKALSEIKPPLTSEQREKLKNPLPLEFRQDRGDRPLPPGGFRRPVGPPPAEPTQ
jgi:Spy/CpxP family protein refolding chaperone